MEQAKKTVRPIFDEEQIETVIFVRPVYSDQEIDTVEQ